STTGEIPMKLSAALLAGMLLPTVLTAPAFAADPESCKTVRMAQPGWNDLLLTHSIASVILKELGYEAENSLLGLNVIFTSLEQKNLDVYLGFWDPAMAQDYGRFRDEGIVDTVGVNLEGAKYTFAAPTYVWEAGLKDVHDLHKYADKFDRKMYGIEPGSNQPMLDMIADPDFKLDGWEVVESSEQGMLTQVERAIRRKEWILFQGWAPHPMNDKYDFKYLTGGDEFYGPDFGAATVSTVVRKGYQEECPNVTHLLKNLKFDVVMENKGIGYLTEDDMEPDEAAAKIIAENAGKLDAWLDGVETVDGKPGLPVVKAGLGL
ncbi:MAG: choline ABC transporter substrate-binding protein, partial [Planctomycetales bacterium]|nr:choline ABC transporter substrate-binding protein [Planctomycetales bacterium]